MIVYSKHLLYCIYIYARNIVDVMKKNRTYSGTKFKHMQDISLCYTCSHTTSFHFHFRIFYT
jgi:hypothetical protein